MQTARGISKVILASQSPRRLELLTSLNFPVVVAPSSYEEPEHPHLSPRELAIEHARNKLADVAGRKTEDAARDNVVIVAADTVVDVDGTGYNKPSGEREAARMLRDLSGRTHVVHTAFSLRCGSHEREHCESTRVTFFALDDDLIAQYVASGEPMDKAGAYGIQGFGATLVRRIEGDFYTVMGFPVAHFALVLRELGFALPITKKGINPV